MQINHLFILQFSILFLPIITKQKKIELRHYPINANLRIEERQSPKHEFIIQNIFKQKSNPRPLLPIKNPGNLRHFPSVIDPLLPPPSEINLNAITRERLQSHLTEIGSELVKRGNTLITNLKSGGGYIGLPLLAAAAFKQEEIDYEGIDATVSGEWFERILESAKLALTNLEVLDVELLKTLEQLSGKLGTSDNLCH